MASSGHATCSFDGDEDGENVGLELGDSLEDALGEADGEADGDALGDALGEALGLDDGDPDAWDSVSKSQIPPVPAQPTMKV